jgi:hypothetical protein
MTTFIYPRARENPITPKKRRESNPAKEKKQGAKTRVSQVVNQGPTCNWVNYNYKKQMVNFLQFTTDVFGFMPPVHIHNVSAAVRSQVHETTRQVLGNWSLAEHEYLKKIDMNLCK